MKKTLFLLISCFCFMFDTYSQELNIKDLIFVASNTIESSDSLLYAKKYRNIPSDPNDNSSIIWGKPLVANPTGDLRDYIYMLKMTKEKVANLSFSKIEEGLILFNDLRKNCKRNGISYLKSEFVNNVMIYYFKNNNIEILFKDDFTQKTLNVIVIVK